MKLIQFLLFFISISLFGNEANLEIAGGTVKPLYDSATNVKMDSELVVITLNSNNYTVDAEFYFSNQGETEILAVGFPKYGYGYLSMNIFRGVKYFNYFMTFVNDTPVEFHEMLSEIKLSNYDKQFKVIPGFNISEIIKGDEVTWFSETKWMVKNVIFRENSKVTTEVSYEAPFANYGFYQGVEYLYGTGKTWAGNIGKSRFIINFSENTYPLIYLNHTKFIREEYELNRIDKYSIELIVKDFEPDQDATLSFAISTEKFPWDWDYEYYTKNVVSNDQLKIMNQEQLRFFRNSFYARHGRVFKSDDLQQFFYKDGYFKTNKAYHDSLLNEIELENVKKIYDYEQMLKAKFGE